MSTGTPARPTWVCAASLGPVRPTDYPGRLEVGGLLLLDPSSPAGLRPSLLVDGSPVETTWRLPSPPARKRFADLPDAERARFRSEHLPARGGLVELALVDDGDDRLTLAVWLALPPDHPGALRLGAVSSRLTELVSRRERDHAAYTALRRKLRRVPESDRDAWWKESMVLVDGWFRQRPTLTHRRVRELRDHHERVGTSAHFDALLAHLNRLTQPYSLTPHGYKVTFASRDEPAIWAEAGRLNRALTDLGYEAFVNSGTLLGLVRDGALIPHDDDVDFAVLLAGETDADVARSWRELRDRLAQAGLLRRGQKGPRRTHVKLAAAGGLSVDVFPAWVRDGRVHVWPHTYGDVEATDLLPLAERTVHDAQVLVPRTPEKFLELNYGPRWRTADPVFRFDWAPARERFAPFLGELGAAPGGYATAPGYDVPASERSRSSR